MGEPAIICGYRHPSGRGGEDESLCHPVTASNNDLGNRIMAEFKAPVEDILALQGLLSAGWSDTGFDAETAATVILEFAFR